MDSVSPSFDLETLRRRVGHGDGAALGEVFSRFQDRLLLLVRLRIARRLQSRLDAADVLQEVYFEAARRLEAYLQKPDMPLYLWLRFLTLQQLLILHRRYAGT